MKKFLMRSRTWRIIFCPESSDGCEESTELTQEMVQTPCRLLADSSTDDNSRNSGNDTYSDRNSSSGSELSELAIHTLQVETRARDLDREVYQDPYSDRYLIPGKIVFDNAADDLEKIAVSKRSMSLLPQKQVVRNDLQPYQQETQPLAKTWCVKMEEDTHQPNELNSQMRVVKTYL